MATPSSQEDVFMKQRAKEMEIFEQARREALETPTESPTLLWRSAAHTVTLATGAAAFWIKAGSGAAKWGLSAGRQATHGVIGLNQAVLETVLKAAGKNVNSRTEVALRQAEAEHLIDTWITSLHTTWTATSILAASGFYVAESALSWSSESSLYGLHFLNALFGSTETSRAVAAIVQLMKKELNKPGSDGSTDRVYTYELFTTVASFLFLQRSGKRKTEIEWRAARGDATIWDIVIDDRGFRADVIGTRRPDVVARADNIVQSPIAAEPTDDIAVTSAQVEEVVLPRNMALSAQDQANLSDEEIKQKILEQLPPGAKATITSETMTVKTIRVDIHGSETTNIEAPPGMVMVSEHPNFDNSSDVQTVVFQTVSKVDSRAEVTPDGQLHLGTADQMEPPDTDDGGITMRASPPRSLPVAVRRIEDDTRGTVGPSAGPLANQKKSRKNATESSSPTSTRQPGVMRRALKSLSPTQSSASMNKIVSGPSRSRHNSAGGIANSLSQTLRPLTSKGDGSRRPMFHIPTTQPTTPLMSSGRTTPAATEGQSGGYFTVHEQRRESTYSQTDTFSLHSNDSRPPSPTMSRTHLRASNSISKTQSQTEISLHQNRDEYGEASTRHHQRTQSFVPSLYSMGTKNSGEDTLVLAPKTPILQRSIFEDDQMLMALAKDGIVPGQFPRRHLIWTLRRFGRFASAVYGENFLKWMGLPVNPAMLSQSRQVIQKDVHYEHLSFALYTGLPEETIIKSSYLEPQGMHLTHDQGFTPLIHFVTIDLESKAIVLSCRGTLGFEDLLTDMACDSADLYWQGQPYHVHRGIRDAARRLMDNRGGNHIMAVLKASLEEYPEFGLVLVGHSLGGAVAAMLAIMLSEPSKHEPGNEDKPSFVTATRPKLLPSKEHAARLQDIPPITLPSGRPIHVYAFGSPACVSPTLRVATRGLITSVINANDIVPYLSLGTLHDMKAIARRLKEDLTGGLSNIKRRATERILGNIYTHLWAGHTYSESTAGPPPPSNLAGDALGEDNWMWNELVEMRKVMTHEKLLPPGEVFTLESTRVFDRDPDESTTGGAEQAKHYTPLGRPATRIQLKYVRNVEKRFSEIRFTRSMFAEHTPYNYENNLSALERGVYDDAL